MGTYTAQPRTGYDDPLGYLENSPRGWTLTRKVRQISRMKSKISRLTQPFDRSEIERQEFAEAILRELPRDGSVEVQPGLTLFRVSAPTAPAYGVSESCFCVIAQGAKHVMLGEDRLRYDPNHYLISTVGLPIISQVDVASPKEPYLGLRLVLDPAVVTSTMVESGFAQRQNDSVKAIAVSKLDSDLLNACLRLLGLLQLPEQYRVLGPARHSRDHLPASYRRAGPSDAPPGNDWRPCPSHGSGCPKVARGFRQAASH